MDEDFIGDSIIQGGYEVAESNFVGRFVKPGMTVLDIGAHRGFHSLLLSKKVGRNGRLLSFEPSPADAKRLRLHLRINFCSNAEVFECALGEEDEAAELYVVPKNSVLNSLRPPDTEYRASTKTVAVKRLDNALSQAHVERVDFVKLDVEGGELSVLKGAQRLLSSTPRPLILCEVLEQRTRPWGYPARLIIEYLLQMGFVWFELSDKAELQPIASEQSEFNGNFVAVPSESLSAAMPQDSREA
jgi:FkbM family methyltransferase